MLRRVEDTRPSLDLNAKALKSEPGPVLARIRAKSALAEARIPLLGAIVLTTTHRAAETMLKDRAGFVSNPATAGLSGGAVPAWLPKRFKLLGKNMVLYDEPDHKRLRGLVDLAFARRGVAEMRAPLERETEALLDQVDPSGFDIVSALARPLPLSAISALLGLPEKGKRRFEALARPLSQGFSGLAFVRALWTLGGLVREIERLIAAAKAGDDAEVAPDGLIALLAAAEGEGERLDAEELTAMILTLLIAGHETTTHLISGGVWALLTHPEQLARLKSGEVSVPEAVEELLRWLSPVMLTKARFAAQDGELDGAPIKRGERIAACLIAANHDPARWEDPERLDLGRKPAGHLAFGAGIHFCLGLTLARMEAEIAFSKLLERFPDLQLAGEPEWTKRPGVRGFDKLPVNAD